MRRDESIVETLHGVKVADPYRWLESPDAEETKHCEGPAKQQLFLAQSIPTCLSTTARADVGRSCEQKQAVCRDLSLLRPAGTTSDWYCSYRAVCDAQNKVTNSLMEQCSTREPFRQLLTEMYDYPRFRVPSKKGSRYYYR